MKASLSLGAGMALVLSGVANAQIPGPCWESNLGTNLSLADDQLSGPQALSFNFPLPSGATTNSIDVDSNGWVGLVSGAFTGSDLSPTAAELVSGGERIAANWTDLNPAAGGGVFFNNIPGTSGSPDRAIITWDQVPEFGEQNPNSIQLQLISDGSFIIAVREQEAGESQTVLVGVSAGGGVADPGAMDLSIGGANSNTEPTLYETFGARDLDGGVYYFIPNGSGGYVEFPVASCSFGSADRYGTGCPSPAAFYEQFANPGTADLSGQSYRFVPTGNGWVVQPSGVGINPNFAGNLGLGDDALAVAQPLGFNFPIPGAGTTNAIDIDSNGRIGLISGLLAGSDFSESPAELLAAPTPLIAAFWDDLDPSSGGGVYFDALGGSALITWDQVPQFFNTDANTFQVELFPDGSMVWSWGTVADDALVGFSIGNVATDPGSSDLTARVPFSFAGFGTPVDLDTMTDPIIGTSFVYDITNIPASAAAAVLNIGAAPLNLDLTALGAPGCTLLAAVNASLPFAVSSGAGAVSLPLPNSTALVGAGFYSQAIILAPGINRLNGVTSNGLLVTVGQ